MSLVDIAVTVKQQTDCKRTELVTNDSKTTKNKDKKRITWELNHSNLLETVL